MTLSVGIVTMTISSGKTPFGLIELVVTQMHLAQALGTQKISVSEQALVQIQ